MSLACIVGLLSGCAAQFLKGIISWISGHLVAGAHADGINILLFILPFAGILLTGIFVRYVLRVNIAHGVRQLKGDIAKGYYHLKDYLMVAPIAASSITLGFGGSAGSEGPIAYTGAAIGSNVGKIFRVSPEFMKILVGCGAGAGIAGIFKAPIGGMLFTLEVLGLGFSPMAMFAVLIACLVSGLTAYLLSGSVSDITFVPAQVSYDTKFILIVLVLGVIAGFYSMYYSFFMKKVERWLEKIENPWIKNVIAGSAIGLLVMLFPALYGEGYGVVGDVLSGDLDSVVAYGMFDGLSGRFVVLTLVLVGILACKCFATSATNSGGGVAGDFAPTLFAGCVVGLLFALVANKLGVSIPFSDFAYYGMAGVMAGAIRAPFMAIFLTLEMTGRGECLLPLAIVAVVSFCIVRLFTMDSFFSRHQDRLNGIISMTSKNIGRQD